MSPTVDVQGPDAVLTGPVGGGATLDLTSGQVLVSAPRYGAEVVLGGPQGPQGEVEFLPALTGAPGTDVVLEDLDPSPHRALIQLTVPEGMPGAPGPAIGGILTTKGDLVARDTSTAVRLPVGAPNTVLTSDPAAAAGVKWADPAAAGSAGWPAVTLWADLPTYTTMPLGTKIHVTSGLGFLVALRGPTGWVVAPDSDTQWQPCTERLNGWTGGTLSVRRTGSSVNWRAVALSGTSATADTILNIPAGFQVPGSNAAVDVTLVNTSYARALSLPDTLTCSKRASSTFWLGYVTDDAWPTVAPS